MLSLRLGIPVVAQFYQAAKETQIIVFAIRLRRRSKLVSTVC